MINRTFDAGHFYAKTYSFLRFIELNVHGQCVSCNRFKGSNQKGYKEGIKNRLNQQQIEYLEENKHKEFRLTIPEIKDLIDLYSQRINKYED